MAVPLNPFCGGAGGKDHTLLTRDDRAPIYTMVDHLRRLFLSYSGQLGEASTCRHHRHQPQDQPNEGQPKEAISLLALKSKSNMISTIVIVILIIPCVLLVGVRANDNEESSSPFTFNRFIANYFFQTNIKIEASGVTIAPDSSHLVMFRMMVN